MSASPPAERFVEATPQKSHIKRPPNAWVIYRIVKQKEYILAHPGEKSDLPKISKIISQQWRSEPDEVIRHFERLAKEKMLELLALHPDYRYRPRPRGSGDKQQSKIKRGVTKPRRTTKAKAALTSAVDLALTQATNVHASGGEWSETYNLPSVSSDSGLVSAVVPCDQYAVDNGAGLGFGVAPVEQSTIADNGVSLRPAPALEDQHAIASDNVATPSPAITSSDQHAIVNSVHAFYNDPIFSPDTFDMRMLNHEAQPMNYYGQPYQPYASHTAMQPFAASQVNAYQTVELSGQMQGGYAVVYEGQLYANHALHQPSHTYGTNDLYGQATEVDVADEASGAYTTTYSQTEPNFGYSEYENHGFTNANTNGLEHAFFNDTVDPNGVQTPSTVWNNFTEIMAIDRGLQSAWATVAAAAASARYAVD